jgi:hypothetical protein
MSAEPTHHEIHCSFCGKSQVDVEALVAGPGVQICDACVALSASVLADVKGKPVTPQTRFQDYWPTEVLLRQLKLYESAVERVDRSMRDAVDILRERDVSWTRIGEALGVSRQAAWKRLG